MDRFITTTPVDKGGDGGGKRVRESGGKESESEEDENSNILLSKKVRITDSAVHKEFSQVRNEKGKWMSKCLHCNVKATIYNHKNPSELKKHLEKKHEEIFNKVIGIDDAAKQAKVALYESASQYVKVGSTSIGKKTASFNKAKEGRKKCFLGTIFF